MELRGVTAETTSPAANRLAVRVTPATLMLVLVPATIPVLVMVPGLVTILASPLAHGGRGEFRGMYRATGDHDERSGACLAGSAAFLSATQRV
jgi:hypothetical protein